MLDLALELNNKKAPKTPTTDNPIKNIFPLLIKKLSLSFKIC